MKKWGKDREVVFESALVNTYFISPPRIYHWEKMLFDKEYAGDNFMDILSQYKPNRGISGNCLSTEKRTNGAAAIFLPEWPDGWQSFWNLIYIWCLPVFMK